MVTSASKPKLRWQCRRGMLELDLLLLSFLDNHYDNLPDTLKLHFVELLEQSDTDLYQWLIIQEVKAEHPLVEIINLIRMEYGTHRV